MKYYLRKNEKNIEVNKVAGTERLPYFTLFEIVDSPIPGQDAKFREVAALWKSKSGKGYSGKTSEPRPQKKVEIKPDDIPFD